MKKLLKFFSGKSTQISIISVALCLVIAVSAGVAIHNNNKRVENALNALSSTSTTEGVSESTGETETSTESTTEATSKKQNKTTTTVTEPAGDRTAQYIAEYNRITKEYEEKRARIEAFTVEPDYTNFYRHTDAYNGHGTKEQYESRCKEISEYNSSLDNDYIERCSYYEESKKEQLKELDEQYESDIRELKREFGIFE